jgi:hypothetical protein
VTFVLQNLRNTEPEFDKWYSEYAQEMKSDPLLTYFKELRNILEKEGNLELSTRIHLKKFVFSRDLYRFGPPPANAKSMFIGDSLGGAGWEVELPDGSIEKYYVNLPSDLGEVALHFPQGPKSHLGKEVPNESIEVLSGLYLNYLENLVKQAQQEFGK